MIINPYRFGGFDPDAQAFITAANITDNTQKTAINQLVLDLKAYNIWSKMKAIYPFVGGTASTHKFNLKDPRDLDAAFRLVFNGGWTHSSTGALPNGTNGWANTFFIPLNQFSTDSSAHLSYYSRTNNSNITVVDFGASNTTTSTALNTAYSNQAVSNLHKTSQILTSNTNTLGYYIGSRINSTTHKLFKNNSQLGSTETSASGNRANINIYIGSLNDNGTAVLFSPRQVAFATIGDGLTDTDATNLSWITEQYQTTLGRSVNPWYNNGNLLLDNYPNAAVAYSVRKLRNYYIGAAIRVRRSSDNTEQNIYFDSTGNLDTASLLSFVGAGNGFVTTWYDQSGNGNNLTQTTAANQPRIVNAGVLDVQNGKPTLVYDGSNDTLFRGTTNILKNKTQAAMYVAARYITVPVSSRRFLFYISDGANNSVSRMNMYGINTTLYYGLGARRTDGGTVQNLETTLQLNNTTMFLQSNIIDYGNSDAYIYINNNLEATSTSFLTNGSTSNTDALYVGIAYVPTQQYTNANISEAIFYESTSNISAINTNINSYYTIWSSGPTWDGTQSGMLNTYSGAAVAYSVRALNSAYTGPLIRVRRSSDNAEINIFALYNGELDTTFLLNFVGAGNGFVTTWYDQSGNGNNATQATAANQPQIVSNGNLLTLTGIGSAKPILRFDGINDNFDFSNTIASIFTSFYPQKKTANADLSAWFSGTTSGNPYSPIIFGTAGTYISNSTKTTYSATYNNNNYILISGYVNLSNDGFIQVNNSAITLGLTLGATGTHTFNKINMRQTGNFSKCDVPEMILYASDNSANISAINTNINNYYQIY